jgi:hypothetical protein
MRVWSAEAGQSDLNVVFNDESSLEKFQALASQGFNVETGTVEDTAEYLYTREDMLNLDGKANRHRRHAVNSIQALGQVEVVRVDRTQVNRCMEMEKKWCVGRDCAECSKYYGCEKEALARCLAFFDDSIHRCYIARVNGVDSGYLICQKKGACAFMFFGKGLVDNMLPYLVSRVFVEEFPDCGVMNYAEDMGNPGLRTAKERLGPHTMLHRYWATIR